MRHKFSVISLVMMKLVLVFLMCFSAQLFAATFGVSLTGRFSAITWSRAAELCVGSVDSPTQASCSVSGKKVSRLLGLSGRCSFSAWEALKCPVELFVQVDGLLHGDEWKLEGALNRVQQEGSVVQRGYWGYFHETLSIKPGRLWDFWLGANLLSCKGVSVFAMGGLRYFQVSSSWSAKAQSPSPVTATAGFDRVTHLPEAVRSSGESSALAPAFGLGCVWTPSLKGKKALKPSLGLSVSCVLPRSMDVSIASKVFVDPEVANADPLLASASRVGRQTVGFFELSLFLSLEF